MKRWSPWDWVAYAVLLTAAVVLAADGALKGAPTLFKELPAFFHSEIWAFIPLALVVLATTILILREFGFLRSNETPAGKMPLETASIAPAEKKGILVDFNNREGRVQTKFNDGTDVVYFRLTVGNRTGATLHGCEGHLVGVGRRDSFGAIIPSNYSERLSLTWATHTGAPVTSLDIRDNNDAILDVICIASSKGVLFATPNLGQPNSFDRDFFQSQANFYVLTIRLDAAELQQPINVGLELAYMGQLYSASARIVY